MKRRIIFVLAALLFALLLGGCRWLCRHAWTAATCEAPKTCIKCDLTEGEELEHQWEKATCELPRICGLCGKTRGIPKGHRWTDATCEDPEICTQCGNTQGEPKGHHWQEATCLTPKTCLACAATEGEALGHVWREATTEEPKTCTGCGMTTGFAIDTDARFTTAETAVLQGTWQTDFAVSGSMVGEPDFTDELRGKAHITFGNAGKLTVRLEMQNLTEFEEAMLRYIKERIYTEFSAKGLGTAAADLAIRAAFGVDTDEYAARLLEEIDVLGVIRELTKERVYYAKGDTVYIADDWNSVFLSSTYRFENGKLIFDELPLANAGEPLLWSPERE